MRVQLKPDPLGFPRNPLAVYLLAVALFTGVLELVGLNTARSVEDTLPPAAQLTWAGLLTLGSGSSLVGLYWPGTIPTGLVLKQVGMFTLGVASSLYALLLVVAFGVPALTQAAITLGLALACWLHHRQIKRRVEQVIRMSALEGGRDR